VRYLIREKLMSFGDDFWIENETGGRVYKIDGHAFTILREKLSIEDAEGNEIGFLREKLVSLRKAYEIHLRGKCVATVSKDLLTLFRCSFTVDVLGPNDLEAQGSLLDHEYTFSRGGDVVATVSKRWFSIRDTYAVEMNDDQEPLLILASAIAIDQMCHDKDGESSV
jgi:uncharacterized protein YxjI